MLPAPLKIYPYFSGSKQRNNSEKFIDTTDFTIAIFPAFICAIPVKWIFFRYSRMGSTNCGSTCNGILSTAPGLIMVIKSCPESDRLIWLYFPFSRNCSSVALSQSLFGSSDSNSTYSGATIQ